MARANFIIDLSKRYSKQNERKYYFYFMWKNGLKNSETDFSKIEKEEFIQRYLRQKKDGKIIEGRKGFELLESWETSTEYQELMQDYYMYKMNQDFYKLYDTYLEKALNGDEKSVNALKTIKKEIESLNKANRTKSKENKEEESNFDLS